MAIARHHCAVMENRLDGFIKLVSQALGMMGLTVSTLERLRIQLAFKNGLVGYLDHSEDPQVISPLSQEPI